MSPCKPQPDSPDRQNCLWMYALSASMTDKCRGCGCWLWVLRLKWETREGSWGRAAVNSDVVRLVWSWRWVLPDDWGKGRTFVMCEETCLCFHSVSVSVSLPYWNSDKDIRVDVVMSVENFAPLLWGAFYFDGGVVCRNHMLVWSAEFPQQSSQHSVFYSHVLCSCSVVSYISRWSNADLFLTLSQQAVTRPWVSATSLILWHQLRQRTSKTAAFHMLEDVIQRCRWWVITSRTWECLFGTRLVAFGRKVEGVAAS